MEGTGITQLFREAAENERDKGNKGQFELASKLRAA